MGVASITPVSHSLLQIDRIFNMALSQRRMISSLSLPTTACRRPLISLQTIPAVTTTFTSSSTAPISASDLEKLQVLGRGSGGTVHKVLHKPTSTTYTLKQLDSSSDNYTLQSELDILCRTTGFPNIVRCHAILQNPTGTVSILLEYMESGSLESLLKSQGPFSEENLALVARDVLRGLNYLHKTHKIAHNDIKPANLLMNGKKEVKIADFGCSSDESCSTSLGTWAYMSPERFDREKYGASGNGYASDIWSFGVTLMELYMSYFPLLPKGQKPDWSSLMMAICFREESFLPEGGSEDFRSFIECCMHKDASKRWTAAQLLTHPFICKVQSEECKPSLLSKKRKHDDDNGDGDEQRERSQRVIKVE